MPINEPGLNDLAVKKTRGRNKLQNPLPPEYRYQTEVPALSKPKPKKLRNSLEISESDFKDLICNSGFQKLCKEINQARSYLPGLLIANDETKRSSPQTKKIFDLCQQNLTPEQIAFKTNKALETVYTQRKYLYLLFKKLVQKTVIEKDSIAIELIASCGPFGLSFDDSFRIILEIDKRLEVSGLRCLSPIQKICTLLALIGFSVKDSEKLLQHFTQIPGFNSSVIKETRSNVVDKIYKVYQKTDQSSHRLPSVFTEYYQQILNSD